MMKMGVNRIAFCKFEPATGYVDFDATGHSHVASAEIKQSRD